MGQFMLVPAEQGEYVFWLRHAYPVGLLQTPQIWQVGVKVTASQIPATLLQTLPVGHLRIWLKLGMLFTHEKYWSSLMQAAWETVPHVLHWPEALRMKEINSRILKKKEVERVFKWQLLNFVTNQKTHFYSKLLFDKNIWNLSIEQCNLNLTLIWYKCEY